MAPTPGFVPARDSVFFWRITQARSVMTLKPTFLSLDSILIQLNSVHWTEIRDGWSRISVHSTESCGFRLIAVPFRCWYLFHGSH